MKKTRDLVKKADGSAFAANEIHLRQGIWMARAARMLWQWP